MAASKVLGQRASISRTNNIALFPSQCRVSRPRVQLLRAGEHADQFTGIGGGDPNINIENTYQLSDNVSIIRGNHAFKTGIDARNISMT